jgi:lipid A ethanolaminephosphotransferase
MVPIKHLINISFQPFRNNRNFLWFLLATFLAGNYHLFLTIHQSFADSNFIFQIWLYVFFFLLHLVFISFINLFIPTKYTVLIVVISSGIFNLFLFKFGTIFDVGIWRNIFQTNINEASDLLNFSSASSLLIFFILIIIVINRFNLFPSKSYTSVLTSRLYFILLSLVILLSISWTLSKDMSDFLREHKEVRYLNNPGYGLFNLLKFSSETFLVNKNFDDGKYYSQIAELNKHHEREELIVLVVGETARYDRFGINGYERDTTPNLKKVKNLISYSNFTACGTSTAVSVPCMFALQDSKSFNASTSQYKANVLDVMPVEDVNIHWFDNNSDSKHVADRVNYRSFKTNENNSICDEECRDVGMINEISKVLNPKVDNIIILHQMGSHGPAYHKRYPEEFEKFIPACNVDDITKCSNEEINNAYDNSILYTDYFLSTLIKELEKFTDTYEVTLLYVSDHGESLGENGIYLHGLPKAIAPKEQTHVPVFLWAPEGSSDVDYEATFTLKDEAYTHYDISDTLLRLTEVKTNAYMNAEGSMITLGD